MNIINLSRTLISVIIWIISINLFAQHYKLVTSANELIDGAFYLIVNTEYSKAISTIEKDAKNLPASPVEIENGIIRNIGEAAVFKLEVRTTGYSFYREGKGYLCSTKNDANELTYYTPISPNDYSKCAIYFETDNTASITFNQPKIVSNKLKFNPESSLFNCYTSGQKPVSLFRNTTDNTTKVNQHLHFSLSIVSTYLGDTFTVPTLSGAMTNVTYSSSDTTVATINANTGEVTVLNSGTTTITAIAEANDVYNSSSASYTLIVKQTGELFDFTNPESYGFSPFNEYQETIVDKDIIQGVVTISVTHGATTNTRFYNSRSDGVFLGVYANGGSITFSVPDENLIASIEFIPVSSSDLKGLPNVKNKKWTGEAQTVTFKVTETVRLKCVKVNFKRIADATHIPQTTTNVPLHSVYNLHGQIILRKNKEDLPQGIYIINGKKCIVK